MSKSTALATQQPKRISLLAKMASKYSVDPDKMRETLAATAFRGTKDKPVSNEQMMALLIVADQYNLNPWLKEIYAFPDKSGGIVPVIGVDGWIRMINEHPQFDSMEIEGSDQDEGTVPAWYQCTIHRKDRSRPIVVREFFAECNRGTDPWKQMPHRMLRHKAIIQCARVAFGFSGVHDPDEAERIRDAIDVTPEHVKAKTEEPRAKNGGAGHNEVPVAAIRKRLDETGIPENEFCEQFGADTIEGLALDKVADAQAWIERVAAG